jgi:cytoskeletal protein CcmA (bactofilin family)
LGCGTEFEGKLAFHGTIRVEGRIRGEISGPGMLVIGEKGIVDAEIQARVVIVRGETHGTIRADERIEAYAPAKIFGDLHSPVLVFGEGVIFQGASHMTPGNEKETVRQASSEEINSK